ncbi:MAG: hypothetical protein PVF65_12255 [Sphingomonadales bacterium]|jgi:hypothetical protein
MTARQKKNAERILAVKHQSEDGETPAYITDREVIDLLGIKDDEEVGTIADTLIDGLNILNNVTNTASIETQQARAILFSQSAEHLHNGDYQIGGSNLLPAIETFVIFHHLGLYPPKWVLNWLTDAFGAYLQSGTREDLAALLGAKRGKGQTPISKEMRTIHQESRLMQEIGGLTLLGISINDAAIMAAGRMEDAGIPCPTPETLAERYSKRGWNTVYKPLKTQLPPTPLESIKSSLSIYPAHTLPLRFK